MREEFFHLESRIKAIIYKRHLSSKSIFEGGNMTFEVLDLETGALKFSVPVCLLESP